MLKLLLTTVAICGHVALGTIVLNRLHATALPYWLLKLVDAVWAIWHLLTPVMWIIWMQHPSWVAAHRPGFGTLVVMHFASCIAAAVSLIPGWLHRALTRQTTALQLTGQTEVVDITRELGYVPAGSVLTRLLIRVPGNEVLHLHKNEKRLVVPRLHPALHGFSITHISDLHFTGQLQEDFYHEVVRQSNKLESDIITVTGDLIDKRKCMDWLGDILGQLRAKQGVYFVLGNHDVRVRDEFGIRNALTSVGLIDVGRRWVQQEVRDGHHIVLAGNELPWFIPAANMVDCPAHGQPDSPLRVLLAHSPDQLNWARAHGFDLMLAGHTHGGQIQLPILGPIFSPSRHGVRYCSGTFFEHPTLMHVSRGISGTRQMRYKASPEVTKLVLLNENMPA